MAIPGPRALAAQPGEKAPAFELTLLDGGGSVSSSELLSKHREVFLVFWHTGCPRCVEALLGCERFYRTYGGEDIAVLGINADEGDPLAAQGVIESNGITFPQTRDAGAAVSASYRVPRETIAIFLLDGDGDGRIRAARFDPPGDVGAVMEGMLSSPMAAPAGAGGTTRDARAAESGADVSYRGLQRIRLLAIDARGPNAAGIYGEPVNPGSSVRYRVEVEASKRLAAHLRAGALVRISNEGDKVLESGPEYLGSEWGSAFVGVEAARLRVRLGYYSLHMTPLTLMRWDWDDSPRIGGDTGCGCGGVAAGTLLVESLEELGPDLTVEGALVTWGGPNLDARLFYAMPRRALETSYVAYRSGAADRARYSLELYGLEARWQRLDRRTGLFWKAGLHAVGSFENRRSVDFAALGYPASTPWLETWTASVTSEIPLVRYASLRGELIAWNRVDERGVVTTDGMVDLSSTGGGGVGGIVIERSERLGLMIDYVHLAPDFFTPFSALSYESNTEGLRVSARAPLVRDVAALSLFYKRLRDVEVVATGAERKQISLAGASLDVDVGGAFGAGIGWLEEKSWRDGFVSPLDAHRGAAAANLHYNLGTAGVIRFQYERIRSEDAASGPGADSGADMYSLYSSVNF
jgi:peroxiredoxin